MEPVIDDADLCPDCTTPYIVVNEQNELVRFYHDASCPTFRAAAIENRRRRAERSRVGVG